MAIDKNKKDTVTSDETVQNTPTTPVEPAKTPAPITPQPAQTASEVEKLTKLVEKMQEQMEKMEQAQIAKEKELDEKYAAKAKAFDDMVKAGKEKDEEEIEKVRESRLSKAERTKEKLSKQPLVRMYLPLEGKEKVGAIHPVTINGFRLNVPKGVYVDVPQQIADVLADSFKQTEDAGKAYRLDLNNPTKEGVSLQDALS